MERLKLIEGGNYKRFFRRLKESDAFLEWTNERLKSAITFKEPLFKNAYCILKPSEMLMDAAISFLWQHTEQGQSFWSDIYYNWRDNGA